MDHVNDAGTESPGRIEPIDCLVRWALVIWLSPVILTVLAIGLVGMLASRIGKPAAPVAIAGLHPAHEANRPLGVAKAPARARERA